MSSTSTSSRRTAARVVASALAIAGLAAAGGSAAAKAPKPAKAAVHYVRVVHGTKVVARFPRATCQRRKSGFEAIVEKSEANGWGLGVRIDRFSGFHDYTMEQRPSSNAWIDVLPPTEDAYSNIYVPDFPAPFAGEIRFSANHKLMGVGSFPTWNGTISDEVTVTGVLTCRYPKKKAKKHNG